MGRLLPEEEIKKSKNAVMKDLNFQKNNRKLQMGPQKRKLFIGQLMRDVKVKGRRGKGLMQKMTPVTHPLAFIDSSLYASTLWITAY